MARMLVQWPSLVQLGNTYEVFTPSLVFSGGVITASEHHSLMSTSGIFVSTG